MSRADILFRIRSALDAASAPGARVAAAGRRISAPVTHPRPHLATLEANEKLARFKECLRALSAGLVEVATPDEIPAAIAAYLASLGLPLRLRRGSDAYFAALPWSRAPGLEVDLGVAQADDSVGLSRAVAGIAETGTLALASGPDNPVTLSFLPDTHLVVLDAGAIVGSYEEASTMVIARCGGALPRTLNFVTGASRTGDIGGKIVMGAHGPRRLAVILVAGEA